MAKKKVVTIEGRDITVRELTVADILSLVEDAENIGLSQILGRCGDMIPRAVDCDAAFLRGLAPSDLEILYEAFRDTNHVFFRVAAVAGLPQILTSMRDQVVGNFLQLFSGSLERVTAKPSGDTPGAIS